MHMHYNGVDLGIVRMLEAIRTAEYDPTGQDYLWTRHRYSVEAIYSPQVVYGLDGKKNWGFVTAGWEGMENQGQNTPLEPNPLKFKQATPEEIEDEGSPFYSSPVLTDVALRHALSQPRGHLVITFDSGIDFIRTPEGDLTTNGTIEQILIDAPAMVATVDGTKRRAACDLCLGPMPIEPPSIEDIMGDGRTFLVRFTIEACVNDCPTTGGDAELGSGNSPTIGGPSNPSQIILSHRWTGAVNYNEHQLATRTISGMVIFRADVLNTIGDYPDNYREYLLPPVPSNCIRYIDELTQMPDGFSYRYVVRDVEQNITYLDVPSYPSGGAAISIYGKGRRNVAAISCIVERQYSQTGSQDFLDALLGSVSAAAHAAAAARLLSSEDKSAASARGRSRPGVAAAAAPAAPQKVAPARTPRVPKSKK